MRLIIAGCEYAGASTLARALSDWSAETMGLSGHETYTIHIDDDLEPLQDVRVDVTEAGGNKRTIIMTCRVDTPVEVDYYRNGGILQTVLRGFLKQ